MTPVVSVIVPCYNVSPYLERCVRSLTAQTLKELEIILVDDGSTDDTREVMSRLAAEDSRIRVFRQENAGVTAARLNGVERASGAWIGFTDGDDFVEPEQFERLFRLAMEHHADIAHCGYRMVFPTRTDFYYNTGTGKKQDHEAGVRDLLDGGMVEPGLYTKLFRRSLFREPWLSSMRASGVRINEDLLMNYYLFREANSSFFEDVCPYHYIVRKGSAANRDHQRYHFLDPLTVGQRIFEDTRQSDRLKAAGVHVYVRRLLQASEQCEFPDISRMARQTLRALHRDRTVAWLSRRERCLALLMAYAMPFYRMIRWGYNAVTRVNHAYDIN